MRGSLKSTAPPLRLAVILLEALPQAVNRLFFGPIIKCSLRLRFLSDLLTSTHEASGAHHFRHLFSYNAAVATKTCRVTYRDLDGAAHTVEVTADTLYEAAGLALQAFMQAPFIDPPSPGRPPGWRSRSRRRPSGAW